MKKVKIGDNNYLDLSEDVYEDEQNTEKDYKKDIKVTDEEWEKEIIDDLYVKEEEPINNPKEKSSLSNTIPKAKKGFQGMLGMMDKLTVGVEKANSKLEIGNKVRITNGPFTDSILTITKFVVGGIQGYLPNQKVINIRHGSYVTPKRF